MIVGNGLLVLVSCKWGRYVVKPVGFYFRPISNSLKSFDLFKKDCFSTSTKKCVSFQILVHALHLDWILAHALHLD